MAAASLPRARRSRVAGVAWWVTGVLLTIVVTGWVVGSSIGRPMGAWVAVALTVGPLSASRRWPLAAGVAVVIGASWAAFIGVNDQIRLVGMMAIAVAVACAAVVSRRRSLVLVAVALVLPTLGFSGAHRQDMNTAIGLSLVLTVAAGWGVGNSVHQRRAYTAALQAQATEQAVTEERLRIARELHDMVAHSMGIIAIQSGVGSRVIDSQPDEARNALSAIEVASRETLAGLRGMLGALRTADSDPMQLAPTPGLADLDRLVTTTADLGLCVDLRRSGEPRDVSPEVDLSAYRIVQESVTNVLRHAGVERCRVSIDYLDRALSIRVTDGGHGKSGDTAGFGIAGMSERVHLLGGVFSAGPRPAGGFEVSALLPA